MASAELRYSVARGSMSGTPIVGAVDHFVARHGRAAGYEVRARLPAPWTEWIDPNAPSFGLLGSRWYPYPFVGALARTMAAAVRVTDEDSFVRDLAVAGIDAAMGTAMRIVLRYAVSPTALASKAEESWRLFHDSGRLLVLSLTGNELVTQVAEWPGHDVVVCKLNMEVQRRLLERTGARHVIGHRDKCVAWGHAACVSRVRWSER